MCLTGKALCTDGCAAEQPEYYGEQTITAQVHNHPAV